MRWLSPAACCPRQVLNAVEFSRASFAGMALERLHGVSHGQKPLVNMDTSIARAEKEPRRRRQTGRRSIRESRLSAPAAAVRLRAASQVAIGQKVTCTRTRWTRVGV